MISWKTHFGLRDGIVGETIMLNGLGYTVVGIHRPNRLPAPIAAARSFCRPCYPLRAPGLTKEQLAGGAGFLQITARHKPGVTFKQADAEVRLISAALQGGFRNGHLDTTNNNESAKTWIEEQVGYPVRTTFYTLLIAEGLPSSLIACANVSNLSSDRLSARHKEIAIRLLDGRDPPGSSCIFSFSPRPRCSAPWPAGLGVLFGAVGTVRARALFSPTRLPPNTVFPLDLAADARLHRRPLGVLACARSSGFVPARCRPRA